MSTGETEGWTQFALDPLDLRARSSEPAVPSTVLRQVPAQPAIAASSPADPSPGFDPIAAYLEQLGPSSRRTMREALRRMAEWASDGRCDAQTLPWHRLRIEHTAFLRARLAASVAPATANKYLAALRGVLKQCWRAGLMSAEAYQRAIDIPTVRGQSPRQTKQLGPDDIVHLAQVCQGDSSPAGARDAALLALLHGAGLRRSEVVALNAADYDADRGVLDGQAASNGRLARLLVNTETQRALERWLRIRGNEAGPLFFPVNKGGRIESRRLSEQAIYIACQKRAAEAGLPPTSPEDLRRAQTASPQERR